MEGLKVITVSKSTKTDWSFKSTAWSTAEEKVLTLNKLANSKIVEEEKAMKWNKGKEKKGEDFLQDFLLFS